MMQKYVRTLVRMNKRKAKCIMVVFYRVSYKKPVHLSNPLRVSLWLYGVVFLRARVLYLLPVNQHTNLMQRHVLSQRLRQKGAYE